MTTLRPLGTRDVSVSAGTTELIGRVGEGRVPIERNLLPLDEAIALLAGVPVAVGETGPLDPWDGSGPKFVTGRQITWHYFRSVETAIVVRDDEQELVVWKPAGSMGLATVPADGRGLRDVPLAERFSQRWKMAERPWRGHGIIRVVHPRQPWSVWHFWNGQGVYDGAYINLEAPHLRPRVAGSGDVPAEFTRTHTRDHILDLWIEPSADGAELWLKDADELDAAVAQRRYAPAQAHAIRSIGEHAARQLFDTEPGAVWSEWVDWRAPAEWDRELALPDTALVRELRGLTG